MKSPGKEFNKLSGVQRSCWDIGEDVYVHKSARVNVEHLRLGDRTVINEGAIVEGTEVEMGRECWIAAHAHIGGGNCFHYASQLVAGDWLHMGRFSHVNIARGVRIGNEVGLGRGTEVYTHGAYLSAWEGFPVEFADVEIGDRVWLPNAHVHPGVKIGNDVVVAAMSVINENLPAGCLAGGVPVKILRNDVYPNKTVKYDVPGWIKYDFPELEITSYRGSLHVGETMFDLDRHEIRGAANSVTERVKDQLRRYGVRFKYVARDGEYIAW